MTLEPQLEISAPELEPSAEHLPRPRAEAAIHDYRWVYRSRQASLLGRREVLTGKAKFGIFGDGKELAQVAMARVFEKGDFRAGYYRDQTLLFALGLVSLEQFFAQLYAHADPEAEPSSGGRQMTAHFATRLLAEDGSWLASIERYNSAADLSPTGSQMPKLVGLAYASRLYREVPELAAMEGFSRGGSEIAFGTIGNASCAEGMFWESVNAVGVLGAPMLLSIWDDGYGISVPNEQQVTKGDLSAILSGFAREAPGGPGYELFRVPGWDYEALCSTYREAAELVRREHVPAIVHVIEITQPQGHSTSGSHERYKSSERLDWERDRDCLTRMRTWMLERGVLEEAELESLEREERERVTSAKTRAFKALRTVIDREVKTLVSLTRDLTQATPDAKEGLEAVSTVLLQKPTPGRRDLAIAATEALIATRGTTSSAREALATWRRELRATNRERYSSDLYCPTERAASRIAAVAPTYGPDPESPRGFEILNHCFDAMLGRDPRVIAFGEDVGKLGDVNQGFLGLQEKYGELRVSDTGIRELTIVGQALGMALRGLRPIAEIQYLDYLLYALQNLSDDVATLRYRTLSGQQAPLIIRTRGHRLEGMWHSGSLLAGILNLVRGIVFCVPRDMTRAAGFYNTLLESDDPAIVIEVLNGYRLREPKPSNLAEMRTPVGVVETLRRGGDVTLLTYGACCRIALRAAERLAEMKVEVEVIDAQTLLPFDLEGKVAQSLAKTNRLVILDEDVPGGTSAYLLREILERQGGFDWLDAAPCTITGSEHRPAYGSDGDYFSKPGADQVFEKVYELCRSSEPSRFPAIF